MGVPASGDISPYTSLHLSRLALYCASAASYALSRSSTCGCAHVCEGRCVGVGFVIVWGDLRGEWAVRSGKGSWLVQGEWAVLSGKGSWLVQGEWVVLSGKGS
eukprot:301701-Chlamydomonas_euryale.AAC.7